MEEDASPCTLTHRFVFVLGAFWSISRGALAPEILRLHMTVCVFRFALSSKNHKVLLALGKERIAPSYAPLTLSILFIFLWVNCCEENEKRVVSWQTRYELRCNQD